MRIIEVNAQKHFKIEISLSPRKFIGKGRTAQIFTPEDDLSKMINPTYLKMYNDLRKKNIVEKFVLFTPTLENLKFDKANEFRIKRDGSFKYDNKLFTSQSVSIFNSPVPLTDEMIQSILDTEPIETHIEGYKLTTVKQVKDLCMAYVSNKVLNNNKVNKCEKAKTQEELDAVKTEKELDEVLDV